jgi:broad specificity phosphatase PhoE
MGFAVNEYRETLGDIPPEVVDEIGHHDLWSWEQPFVRFSQLHDQGGPTGCMGHAQVRSWIAALESVPDGGSVLVISRGRIIEAGLVAAVPSGPVASWGSPFRPCEGVRLSYLNGRLGNVQIMRVDSSVIERYEDSPSPRS